MATARVRSGVLALAASVAAASPELRGVDDRDLYDLAAARLVGAHEFTSFSVARFANGNASRQELAELGPEALCHCGCWQPARRVGGALCWRLAGFTELHYP